jgi:hypothetical protein
MVLSLRVGPGLGLMSLAFTSNMSISYVNPDLQLYGLLSLFVLSLTVCIRACAMMLQLVSFSLSSIAREQTVASLFWVKHSL